MIIQDAVDASLDAFWNDVVRVQASIDNTAVDIVKGPAKTGIEDYERMVNNYEAQRVAANQDSRTVEVRYVVEVL